MSKLLRNTFSGLLDWFQENDAERWLIYVQACQFDVGDYADKVAPTTGFLTLNISGIATRNFKMHEEHFCFNSRLNGKEIYLEIPYTAVFAGIDPYNGEPILYPYFKDIMNPEPKMPPKQYTAVFNDNRNITLRVPTMEDIRNMMERDVQGPGGYSHYANPASKPMVSIGSPKVNHPAQTTEDKMQQRHWRVIKGSKQKVVVDMPFIDVAYRAKRDAREALADSEPPVIPDPKMRELRSDGASGISSHFPDLDVAKCVFHTNPIPRPDWMTVLEGGQ